MQAQIAASLRHLKEAAAHLSDAALAIGDADKTASANIDHLLQARSPKSGGSKSNFASQFKQEPLCNPAHHRKAYLPALIPGKSGSLCRCRSPVPGDFLQARIYSPAASRIIGMRVCKLFMPS